jgi:hypothetical protein
VRDAASATAKDACTGWLGGADTHAATSRRSCCRFHLQQYRTRLASPHISSLSRQAPHRYIDPAWPHASHWVRANNHADADGRRDSQFASIRDG